MNLSLLRPRLEIVLAVGAGLLAFAANAPSANAKAPPLPPFEAGVERKLAFDWVLSED
jgi:hypothetical protein